MSFPRFLSAHEQAVLRRALAADSADAERLRAQIPFTKAIADCACGCASIDLWVKRAPGVLPAAAPAVIAARILDTDNAGILVFVDPDGYLSLLEIFTHADEPITRFPAPELVEPKAA
ncbi:hypothetical protein F4553_006200 [Allocatelliglobosispora scoriae]|uniref:Uncharacterized protein n=1 Tax=Allocatelliglobosispora scoriae TaxID=643052 RepID=A0A841BYW2_9ACTN|nr:hypothetical protein [Allocatelliglobosispora scoriae]MBB5872766.1 hypothetical protein [Allocatelliglobosispora scoriae]